MSTQINPEEKSARAHWDFRSGIRRIKINIKPNTAIAIGISLLLHGLVLFAYLPTQKIESASVANLLPKTINVQLAGLPAKKVLAASPPIKPKTPATPVIAVEKNTNTPLPKSSFQAPMTEDNSPPKDFMALIKARRQHAQELEDYAARENTNARPLSDEEQRDANIRRNLQRPGTSGIFEIRHKATSTAQFSFKGWKNDGSIPRMEFIDVTAGADGNIDLAIVKRMIEIIRREYKGDFNWESQRLGRVIVLSARMEDNAGLEDFLMHEFFAQRDY